MDFTFVLSELADTSQTPSAASSTKGSFKWATTTSEAATRNSKAPLKQRSLLSDIPLKKLMVSSAQLQQLEEMYREHATANDDGRIPVNYLYNLSDDEQLAASAIMAQQGLDIDTREQMDNRWSQQWSCFSTNFVNVRDRTRRVLYFCRCGYDHTRRQKKERHTPVPFTSCLAHAEITYAVDSEKILRIRGFFHHNDACKQAEFTRIPPLPVHPSVFVVALSQLRDGATFADVKKKNRELVTARGYQGFPADLRTSPYRWLLETRDSRSLYRQYTRMNGVKVTEKPQVNLDEWLDPG
ncbi:hypothetical protein B0H19DRAFT_1274374 [Mycena capillaripes]|nr:hypothetical protein B0H19DRAFT_1274374 [Mycena capillaripes]